MPWPAIAGTVQAAVAANLVPALPALSAAFTRDTGHTLSVSAGATGKLYAQIRSGAPFEVLLAADEDTPARLVREGNAVASSRFTYAVGRLVLWSARPGLVDAHGQVLRSESFRHIAIAAPKVAPYGAAAIDVLTRLGVLPQMEPRFVLAESIGQAYAFVASGNAELGFVALSQVTGPGSAVSGSVWRVPAHLHRPLRQDAVLLRAGEANPTAAALLAWLRGERARAILREHGYETPP
jgi:molybdate transport system substrate-binding protein